MIDELKELEKFAEADEQGQALFIMSLVNPKTDEGGAIWWNAKNRKYLIFTGTAGKGWEDYPKLIDTTPNRTQAIRILKYFINLTRKCPYMAIIKNQLK